MDQLNKPSIESVLAWGSVAYALGFITVMVHMHDYDFPVLQLLYQFDLTAPCMTVALDKLRKGSLIYDSIRWNWY
jgi:hypothetical protein